MRQAIGPKAVVLAAALAASALALLPAAGPGGSPRNGPVVIYLVDTLRFDRMSAYGAARETTPAAQRLAQEGVRYDTAYSVSTWTRPAVASIFTSRPPAWNGAVERGGTLARGVPTMAEFFRQAGWRTAAFSGNLNVTMPSLGFDRGFDVFKGNSDWPSDVPPSNLPPGDVVATPAIRWIEAQTDPHFLLYVHVVDPHAPYDHFRPGYRGMFSAGASADRRDRQLAQYDGLVRQADDQFGRIRASLERRGFWQGALVIYIADHGEQFSEHGGESHGDTLFEETLRVPMIVRGAGWGSPGSVVKDVVSLLDLLPSIAEWAGFPGHSEWSGRSILRPQRTERELYFSEELDGARLYALRRGTRKAIVSMNPPFRIEFNLARDSGEQWPSEIGDDLAVRVERLRVEEIARYGGLWLRRNGSEPIHLLGMIRGVDPAVPFLTWTDRNRFPGDLSRPDTISVDRRLAAGEPFQLHVTRFGPGTTSPIAALSVEKGGETRPLDSFAKSELPVEVLQRPTTILSASEQSEVIRKMRALGYLGGD